MQNVVGVSASQWEKINADVRYQVKYPHDRVVAWTFRNFPVANSKQYSLLDVGCGAGRHALFWAAEGYESAASDYTNSAIEALAEIESKKGLQVKKVVCAAESLDFESAAYDGILSFGVLCYLSEDKVEDFFSEIHRVLKPGGKALIVTRTLEDERCRRGQHLSGLSYRVDMTGSDAPSTVENGMNMVFFDRENISAYCANFSSVKIGRFEFSDVESFKNSDWYIQLEK